jgi:diguanylate cyclase (GGDEF)-like protein
MQILPPAPTVEEKQAIRLRRHALAALSYALVLPLLATGYLLDYIQAAPALAIGAAMVASNAALYAAFRSGLNLRLNDPSLTKFQVYLGITLLMAGLYYTDAARGIVLGLCYLVFLFGVFRLGMREMITLALYALAGYALVINLLLNFRPESVPSVAQEWFQWLLLAVSLPCFALVAGHIRGLRDRLRARNAELQRAIAAVHAMATRDNVTGLYNRSFFADSVEHALAQAERHARGVALLFMDVDRFKQINDTLGHAAGDRSLRAIGERISACVRDSDIVARLGGDEFVALIENLGTPAGLHQLAEKIIAAVAQPLQLESGELVLSVSIGVAVWPKDGRDAPTLMRNADTALYRAKNQGRNRFSFYAHQAALPAEASAES